MGTCSGPDYASLLPDYASLLSRDLWGRILSFAVAGVADESDLGLLSPGYCFKQQAAFHNLRLVCKAFNQAFLDYPHLSRGLVLKSPLGSHNSLMTWLQRHHGSVQTFAGFVESPDVELVLKTLLQRPSALRTVFLQQCNPTGLASLQGWENLTTLEIAVPNDELNLSVLGLTQINTMVLRNGDYRCLHLPEHLSSLTLSGAILVCQPEDACLTSLKKLKLSDSRLQGVHSRGVLGCCSLEGLTCLESLIVHDDAAASSPTDLCCIPPVQVPAEMSVLPNLASLDITIATDSTVHVSFFYGFHSLQDLSVHARGASLHAKNGLHALTRLTSLTLLASDPYNSVEIILDTRWYDLKVLEISCDRFFFLPSLLSLVDLPSLRSVSIVSSLPSDAYGVEVFAALTGLLAKAPNTEFRMNGRNIEQMRRKFSGFQPEYNAGHLT